MVDIGFGGDATQTVRIAHFSVQEYLESQRTQGQKAAIFSLTAVAAHAEIAQISLIYLLEPGLAIKDPGGYPLAHFAASFWYRHYKSAKHLDFKFDDLVLKLFQRKKKLHVVLIQLLPSTEPNISDNFQGGPVYYASLLGLGRVLQELISTERQKDSTAYVLPPTSTSKIADVNIQGGYYGNALQAASYEGHEEVVHLLVELGADVNAQGGEYGNALQAASFSGHEKIVHLLVVEGADVNAEGGGYINALHAASYEGHEKIVRLLVEKGADVNAAGGGYINALQVASYEGREKIVQLLVELGADVNA